MPDKATLIAWAKWLGGAAGVVALVLFLAAPKKETDEPLVDPRSEAVAIKVVELLDKHPEEWEAGAFSVHNRERGVTVYTGVSEGPQTVVVKIDGVEMPGLEQGDQPTQGQQMVFNAAKRWEKRTADKEAFMKAVRQKKAMDKFLAEK